MGNDLSNNLHRDYYDFNMGIKYDRPEYIQWIRNQFCTFCGGCDAWDGINDLPVNTPCHIKTRGSGGKDFNNTIPAYTKCHRIFEDWPKALKLHYVDQAIKLTVQYERILSKN